MSTSDHYLVFDIETRRSFQEVGGHHNLRALGLSVAVVFDSLVGDTKAFRESQIDDLTACLAAAPRIVGFNIMRFDYPVLSAYTDFDFAALPSLDILEQIYRRLGFRVSLDGLAAATLNSRKSASGLDAIRWFREGEWQKLIDYCREDVLLTRDLYEFGRENGYLLYFDRRRGRKQRVPVQW